MEKWITCGAARATIKEVRHLADNQVVCKTPKSDMYVCCLQTIYSEATDELQKQDLEAEWEFQGSELTVTGRDLQSVYKAVTVLEDFVAEFSFTVTCCQSKGHSVDWLMHAHQMFPSLQCSMTEDETHIAVKSADVEDLLTQIELLCRKTALCPMFSAVVIMQEYQRRLLANNLISLQKTFFNSSNSTKVTGNSFDASFKNNSCHLSSVSLHSLYAAVRSVVCFIKQKKFTSCIDPQEVCQSKWCLSISCLNKLLTIDRNTGTVSNIQLHSQSEVMNLPVREEDLQSDSDWLFNHAQLLCLFRSAINKIFFHVDDKTVEYLKVDRLYKSSYYQPSYYPDKLPQMKSKQHCLQPHDDWQTESFTSSIKTHITGFLSKVQSSRRVAIMVPMVGELWTSSVEVAEAAIGAALSFLSGTADHQIQQLIFIIPSIFVEFHQACIGISKKVKAGGDNSSQEVRIEINGLSQEAVEEAKQSFLKEMDKVMMIADWSSSSLRGAISNLDLCKVAELNELAQSHSVVCDINVLETNIMLKGLRSDVECLRDKIDCFLISRLPVSPELPYIWGPNEHFHEIVLSPTTSEYKELIQKTGLSEQDGFLKCSTVDLKLVEMVRIQNRHLYIQFKAYRDRVSRECKEMSFDESVIESELWHGTTAAAGAAICGTEFNRTFADGDNKEGTHFAPDFTRAYHYLQSKVTRRKDKLVYMILAKVVIGRQCVSKQDDIRWPGVSRLQCHSSRDSLVNPTSHTVFHDAAAYPAYVIKGYMKTITDPDRLQ